VAVSEDLSAEALAAAMPGRAARAYRALLSTDADAGAWARADAPAGAVVVADYQAAARGRGGLPWTCRPGRDLCFSVVLRPPITADEEGWLYVAAAVAVLDVLGGDAGIEWPDRTPREGRPLADVAGHAGLGPGGVDWAIVNLLLRDAPAPRAALLARLAEAVERLERPDEAALARYRERCTTLGRRVVAHLIPTWPDGVQIAGIAATVLADGALSIEQAPGGRRVAVRPQHLARLDAPGA
jgi:BirA family biotin operon repressor/biotin-[acetyl-CoA-carboxylase] ligase